MFGEAAATEKHDLADDWHELNYFENRPSDPEAAAEDPSE
jgi:hypothetical protein